MHAERSVPRPLFRKGDAAMRCGDEKEADAMAAESAATHDAEASIRTLGARELLGTRGVVRIEHEGEIYTLRITRNNRLILTK